MSKSKKRWPGQKHIPSERLREAIANQLPTYQMTHNNRPVPPNVRGEPIFPTVAEEVREIDKGPSEIFAIPECPDYRCRIAPDPRGQYGALVIKEKVIPGITPDEPFWSPIKGNAHTGPTIKGFSDAFLALAFAQNWLVERANMKELSAERKKAFMKAKGIIPRKDKSDDREEG